MALSGRPQARDRPPLLGTAPVLCPLARTLRRQLKPPSSPARASGAGAEPFGKGLARGFNRGSGPLGAYACWKWQGGDIASLTAVLVIGTGIIGAIFGTGLLRLLGCRDDAVRGGLCAGLTRYPPGS
ncbi:MAG: LrgB family protein [Chromatiaceae bacterium]|nr:LrgB family protein [Chromatiaceae bacterium]MBP8289741.1 LrgB family protein [Chromatiaceae bacterium]MBP9605010.1 LrgB family protein [Chromatiaceae bacterium]